MPDDPPAETPAEAHEIYDYTASAYAAGSPSADARAAYELTCRPRGAPKDGRPAGSRRQDGNRALRPVAGRSGADVVGMAASARMLAEARDAEYTTGAPGVVRSDFRAPDPESEAPHLRYFAERTPRFLLVRATKE